MEFTELLTKLRDEFNLNPDEMRRLTRVLTEMFDFLQKRGCDLDDVAKLGLGAHMAGFLERLQVKKMVADIGPEIRAQIDRRWMQLAKEMTLPLFREFGLAEDESEIALIALHLGAAKARAEEAEKIQAKEMGSIKEAVVGGKKD